MPVHSKSHMEITAFAGQRFDRLADSLNGKHYLADSFTVADIAMATVLREADRTALVSSRPFSMPTHPKEKQHDLR